MKIFHIITGLGGGGAEAVLYRLCAYDTAHRHIVVSLMGEGKYGPLLLAADIEVHCLNMPRGHITPHGLITLWRLLRQQRPDTVQTWMYHADLIGGVLARLSGIRTVCWGIHNSTLEPARSARSTILAAKLCARLSSRVPQTIVCCSQKAALVHQALGYAKKKFTIIPNGYNLTKFAPDTEARARLRVEWKLGGATQVICMAARFDPQKDHANLIAALSRLKSAEQNFRCVLVGTGMDANNAELIDWLKAGGVADQVLLLGQRNDIPAIMNAVDINVLSSAYGEAFPNVLAEAMACGTPCVTTDVGDAALIVGETGWVVPSRAPEALAESLSIALNETRDITAWHVRQNAARQRISENFSVERMVDAYNMAWQHAKEGMAKISTATPPSQYS